MSLQPSQVHIPSPLQATTEMLQAIQATPATRQLSHFTQQAEEVTYENSNYEHLNENHYETFYATTNRCYRNDQVSSPCMIDLTQYNKFSSSNYYQPQHNQHNQQQHNQPQHNQQQHNQPQHNQQQHNQPQHNQHDQQQHNQQQHNQHNQQQHNQQQYNQHNQQQYNQHQHNQQQYNQHNQQQERQHQQNLQQSLYKDRILKMQQSQTNQRKSKNDKFKQTKRTRKLFDQSAQLELELEFRVSPYLTSWKRQHLSQKLSLTERQIRVWFQNRRMRIKNEKREEYKRESLF